MRISFLHVLLVTICLSFGVTSKTQTIDHNTNVWLMNLNRYQLSDKWFASSELHVRRTDGIEDWQQFLFRPALNYAFNNSVTGSFGYTYIRTSPYGRFSAPILVPENNLWEEITLNHKSGKVGFLHRFRLEHRFIGKVVFRNDRPKIQGSDFKQRFRYRFTGNFPLFQSNKWFASWFDEVFINLNNGFMPLAMNQNWFYLGLGRKLKNGNVQLGYMNQLISLSNNRYESNPTINAVVIFDIDCSKTDKN